MDSLTQFVLGANVAHTVVGKKLGKKSLLIGGLLGTVPDLDVFIDFGDAIANFTMHRGFSHSFLVMILLCFPLSSWIRKRQKMREISLKRWICCVLLCFVTHILLDSLTVYGTQLFWPLGFEPVSISSIFIIDPIYTIWLLLACVIILVFKSSQHNSALSQIALAVSSLYLGWSLFAKNRAESKIIEAFESQGIVHEDIVTTSSPFNTLSWRGIVRNQNGFFEMYYSILADRTYPIVKILDQSREIQGLDQDANFQRLWWFTHGFVVAHIIRAESVKGEDGEQISNLYPSRVVLKDLRMGSDPDYFFSFDVGGLTHDNEFIAADESVKLAVPRNIEGAWKLLKATILGEDYP